ncbi:hypothetical protein QR680_001324 [Steinernema hermaphroditum]|uniref:FXNA-like protease n=1 Tax=Steinernema hermaphroditum TaxID=289476 RepID=A0AA39LFU1_9BILA|nr:hypothetical protein QR680_001324 [Steinernema hermaphroditum]
MEVRSRRPPPASPYYERPDIEFDSEKGERKGEHEKLGFRHWMSIVLFVAIIYAGVVWQDKRMPTVIEPQDQFEHFSEARARNLLNQLASLGPRVSGSEALEVHAFNLITRKLDELASVAVSKKVNRLETDVQRPTGCFDLTFLSSFTLCYHKITNVIARIGPASGPSKHSILLNCHFDTLPDSPGATDDAVSCAIMMEILEVLSHSEEPLENDIVFLFNGAEENFLQASHGFITSHPWKDSVRAFINLEGTGAGGREILFQAGPGNSWLLKTYLDNAPHPHCSVFAQEIFQSGIIPSDTDFRVFRDYGRVPGLDIAYTRNGWLYHTEFDLPQHINEGAIQRSGDNVLAVVKALVKSLYLDQQGYFDEGNRWVFYDVVGLFTIFYTIEIGAILNYSVVAAVLLIVLFRIANQIYTFSDLITAFYHHFLSTLSMAVVGVVLLGVIHISDLTMCWYSMPEIVFPLYIIPMIIAGCGTHSYIARTYKKRCSEMVHYDTVLILFAAFLFVLTYSGVASAFFVLIYVFFPCCRHPIIDFIVRFKYCKVASPKTLMLTQMICFVPVAVFASYAIMMFFDFFVPVMGRMGNLINPEWIMMPLSLLTAMTFVLFTSNLIYVSRRMDYLLKCSVALFLFGFAIIATTRVGVPYKWSEENPRLRRIIALHTKRTMYDFYGNRTHSDNGLFIQAMDYRGIQDLPDHTFLQGSQAPDCSKTKDEYCSLPYYTAIHNLFPPEESRWVPLPGETPIPYPLKISLIERVKVSGNQVNLTFTIHGGYDKLSLHVTPLNNFSLKKWSFTDLNLEEFGDRQTYFVFLTYGHERPEVRKFWILLESTNPVTHSLDEQASLELGVATHYAHGQYQNSETLLQLRQLINNRRKTPHVAVGWWKWAITHLGGTAEFVSGLY